MQMERFELPRRSGPVNISAYPSENFAHVTILNNAETIRHLWKVDILEMGVSPGFLPLEGLLPSMPIVSTTTASPWWGVNRMNSI